MSQTIVTCPRQPLTRDLDVSVTISRPLTEIATDLTMICFATTDTGFPPNNERVRFYSSLEGVLADFSATSEAYFAANAFFSQSPRPTTMAIGAVFEDPQPAILISNEVDLSQLAGIADGSMVVMLGDTPVVYDNLDFTGVSTLQAVAAVLNNAEEVTGLVATVEYGNRLTLHSTSLGNNVSIGSVMQHTEGTYAAPALGFDEAGSPTNIAGYTPESTVSELELIATAAKCSGRPIYGWVIDRKWRDSDDQFAVAQWAEGRVPAVFSGCTNSATAYLTSDTTNIGYRCFNSGFRRTCIMYHNNAQLYPDMSYLAYALSVDYSLADSTITMKFKQLPGISVVNITESQLSALDSRRINVYVAIGNTSEVTREGVQSATDWYTDSLINLDNFREELQVEVYNVFLRNKKVPYTSAGQDKLVSACAKICEQYKRNGTFADRDVSYDNETGFVTEPATSILPTAVAFATASDRASRLAPPIQIRAYEAGAMHRVDITVDVYS